MGVGEHNDVIAGVVRLQEKIGGFEILFLPMFALMLGLDTGQFLEH